MINQHTTMHYRPATANPHLGISSFYLSLTLALLLSDGSLQGITRAAARTPSARVFPISQQKTSKENGLAPVVIVPGTGGNQLEAKLTKEYKASKLWCRSFKTGYFRLWVDLLTLLPPFTSCFSDRLKSEYDAETDRYHNSKGVETRIPYFGTTEGMEYLDPAFRSVSAYMVHLVQALQVEGYISGQTLFGAPYDFRCAPGPHASDVAIQFLENLKDLIEKAYASNGNQPVVIVSHSLGGLWVLYLLNQQSMEWRKTYVAHFVAISAPWGGTVLQMMTFASGNSEGVPFVNPLTVREQQRSTESNLWLLPVPWVFGSKPLVTTSSTNYSASDMTDFLNDIGFAEGIAPYESRVPHLTEQLEAPKIPVTLIFGHGVGTPQSLRYERRNGFDSQPEIVEGDGDGTVNLCSLSAVIAEWEAIEGQALQVIKLAGKEHTKILLEPDSVETIVSVIVGREPWNQKQMQMRQERNYSKFSPFV